VASFRSLSGTFGKLVYKLKSTGTNQTNMRKHEYLYRQVFLSLTVLLTDLVEAAGAKPAAGHLRLPVLPSVVLYSGFFFLWIFPGAHHKSITCAVLLNDSKSS
jgi:hypothetical protein